MKRYTSALMAALLGAGIMLSPMAQSQEQERAYGWQLMTEQERMQHRETMRNLKTEQERERYRMEHHKKMQERAKEKGVTLPDMPGPRGKGMKNGMGNGGGKGMGKGK
ncbi:MAG: hypothetical protein P8Y24_11305 [Gammaproteobacteria bacterium]